MTDKLLCFFSVYYFIFQFSDDDDIIMCDLINQNNTNVQENHQKAEEQVIKKEFTPVSNKN